MKSVLGRNRHLQPLHMVVRKFNNFSALGADEVIMVPSQMPMLIANGLPFELFLLRKAQIGHPIHALPDKSRVIIVAFFSQKPVHLFNGYMFFCIQKGINNV